MCGLNKYLPQVTKPSDTQDGRAFLQRFSEKEQIAAQLLIDSLEIHNFAQVLNALREEIVRIVESENMAPAVLIPIRSREDLPPLREDEEHVAYRTFSPGEGLSSTPGSEGEIGSVIASLVAEKPTSFLPPTITIDEFRNLQAKSVLLITDYCGSGNQALRFAKSFTRHPRLASWLSSGHLRLRVQSYASSNAAVERFSQEKGIAFSALVAAKSGPATDWTETQAESIRSLCMTHSDDRAAEAPLGYKESFGLYLSSYRVPNNLPQILIRSDDAWKGLFPGRRVSAGFGTQLAKYVPRQSAAQILTNIGEHALARFVDDADRPFSLGLGIAMMALLERKHAEDRVIALLGLSTEEWKQLAAAMIALNLIDLNIQLTKAGIEELSRSRRWAKAKQNNSNSYDKGEIGYFPTQLR